MKITLKRSELAVGIAAALAGWDVLPGVDPPPPSLAS